MNAQNIKTHLQAFVRYSPVLLAHFTLEEAFNNFKQGYRHEVAYLNFLVCLTDDTFWPQAENIFTDKASLLLIKMAISLDGVG